MNEFYDDCDSWNEIYERRTRTQREREWAAREKSVPEEKIVRDDDVVFSAFAVVFSIAGAAALIAAITIF